ncbi:MAG: SsrA-binding protein SmpB [Anaerolineales bacterium]|nr:SsrA-binding protein SmpB [Anaerolineales bacterium]MCB9127548.1 SsrA-binding protein SmpB [Ardenticatenales bacterium]
MAKGKAKAGSANSGLLALNRKARHDYFIDETMEAGLVLKGVEIKSMREGRVNLRDSYVVVRNGEAWVRNMHVSPYEQASTHEEALDPMRSRKLLLSKRQIRTLEESTSQKGMTIIPLRLYLNNNRAKLEIGIARGKKLHDKRDSIAEREAKRKMDRVLRGRY